MPAADSIDMAMEDIHISTEGTGPALVLLHGWGMNSAVWQPLVPVLSGRFRVTKVDLPGHGKSPLGEPLTVSALADALALRLPDAATVLGWSLGGLVAMKLAARHPEKVARLVLVASSPRFVKANDWPHAMTAAVLADFAARLEKDWHATLKHFMALQFHNVDGGKALIRAMNELLIKGGEPQVEGLRWGLDTLGTDVRECLPDIRCPVHIVLGEYDRLVPPAAGDAMKALLPQATVSILPGAGHAPFISHVDAFINELDALQATA